MRRLCHVVVLVGLLAERTAAAVPQGFTISDVLDIPGDAKATSMAWAPDGSNRLFITGKEGQVWIVKNGVLVDETFIRLVPRSDSGGELVTSIECGLLSIAFDPDFVRNGHVYVFATLHPQAGSNDIEQQILRFTAVGDKGMDRTIIVRGLASRGLNHNGGTLAFGPDGLIYWAVGDNGNKTGTGNDTVSSAAKIGRAPAIPNAPADDGPFYDGNGTNFDYIFARGFRNPYTMTFEPSSGNLWVNVVGDSWEQVFVVPIGANAGYPEENRNLGGGATNTIAPVIVYPTQDGSGRNIAGNAAVRAGDVLTFATGQDHLFRVGNRVLVSGIDDDSMNGNFVITEVTGARGFRVADPGPDATSGNGSAIHEDYGNVVLGGTFYDGTQFPEELRGDFFFGDYGTGQLVRATVTGGGVSSVDRFHTGLDRYIDASTGPDGALWLVQHGGAVRRITHEVTAQGLVVAPLNLQIVEGGRGVVTVSLAQQPAAAVTVNVQRMSGDGDLTVTGGAALTFTAASWNVPQTITVSSATDGDSSADSAVFNVTSTGIGTQSFRVRATEPFPIPPPPPDAAVADAAPPLDGDSPDARVIDAAVATADARFVDATTHGGEGGVVPPDNDDGCGCRTGGDASSSLLAALALGALVWLRRRGG